MAGPRKARPQPDSGLLDLPEVLLTSILKHLPLKSKIQSEAICRGFRKLLRTPSQGSFVWDTIELNDPVFKDAHPSGLAWWLMQRRHGIRSLQCTPGESHKGSYRGAYREPALAAAQVQRKRHFVFHLIPQLAAVLPPEAEIQLDLRFANAERLLGSLEPTDAMPGRYAFVVRHWASLAGSLTRLELRYARDISYPTTSALDQLTRLQYLSLDGLGSDPASRASAALWLSFPHLQKLFVSSFAGLRLWLNCPQLKKLQLIGAYPLEALEGIPQGIERVCLAKVAEGSMPLEMMFHGHRLEHLTSLNIRECPEAYAAPGAVQVYKQAFRSGRLRKLETDCPLVKLTPLQRHQCALPDCLQVLKLHLPLGEGLPLVLEGLPNLRVLEAINTEGGLLHLDRPLDPFLDMVHLERFAFSGGDVPEKEFLDWTPDALKYLALAAVRILEGGLLPPGRKLDLAY